MQDVDVLSEHQDAPQATRYWRHGIKGWQAVDAPVAREAAVTIFVNQQEWATILCTPVRVNHLVLGFLKNEGVIAGLDDVLMMRVCDEDPIVDVRLTHPAPALSNHRTLTSGCGAGFTYSDQVGDLSPVMAAITITPEQVHALVQQLQAAATLFRESGGVHTAALSDGERLLIVAEDVGRHNTIDKIRGQCILQEIPTTGCLLLTTGRLSSEIVIKAARMDVPMLVSRNSPTNRAIGVAEALGVTLVGYARGGHLNVYTYPDRITGFSRGE